MVSAGREASMEQLALQCPFNNNPEGSAKLWDGTIWPQSGLESATLHRVPHLQFYNTSRICAGPQALRTCGQCP